MLESSSRFTPASWRPTRWLVEAGPAIPEAVRGALLATLYGTLPIFAGGVVNTIAVALLVRARHPSLPFRLWCAAEVTLCCIRLLVLVTSLRAARRGQRTRTDLYICLSVLWAGSVGYGSFITVASGDWIASTLACLSAAGMVGGICFRNFGAPRLVAVMILLSLGPCAVAGLLSGKLLLIVMMLQIPFYVYSMTVAAFRLNRMLVATMCAERDNDFRAHHDELTGLLNRAGLDRAAIAYHAAPPTLFYIDLDRFKAVNDQHGHAAGDRLLVMVADRLRQAAGNEPIVARVGGDEFVMLGFADNGQAASRLGERLHRAITAAPYPLGQASVSIGASIGIALPGSTSFDWPALMNRADRALYVAKKAGGGCSLAGDPVREDLGVRLGSPPLRDFPVAA